MLKGVFIFFAGMMVGGLAVKYKYEQIIAEMEADKTADEDVIKEEPSESEEKKGETDEASYESAEKSKYDNIINQNGYDEKAGKEDEPMAVNLPYIISPEQFGENDDYDMMSMTYYANDILTDDDNQVIEDVEGSIGLDFINHFGEYEEDAVFVRNDRTKYDYEILKDYRSFPI